MPATALATWDKRGRIHDPARVFDGPFSVAYATDLAYRLKRRNGARTWGDVRAGWKYPSWATKPNTHEGKARTLRRFREALETVEGPPDLPGRSVDTSVYPGFGAVLAALMAEDGRPIA